MTFTLNRQGGAEVLKELVADEIAALAAQIAAEAGDGATVTTLVTDRAKARVTVPAEFQAKDGVLTRAASAAGLELRPPRKAQPKKARPKK